MAEYVRFTAPVCMSWLAAITRHRDMMAILWPPYAIREAIIFLPCGFFFYLSFYLSIFSSPNLSRRRLDVCHTSTHGVALVQV